jgi:hypothetical protein
MDLGIGARDRADAWPPPSRVAWTTECGDDVVEELFGLLVMVDSHGGRRLVSPCGRWWGEGDQAGV